LIGHMLSHNWYGFPGDWYDFPGTDLNVALRLALEVCPEVQELVYDVTDLIRSGDIKLEQDLVEYGLSLSAEEYNSTAKIILLTEGRSDSWILQESLVLLYPHLADYYSFMDFNVARVGGGAGNLANFVKAFAGAGIINRTIALFDNDTAGAAGFMSLEKIALPPHIIVLRLPDLELLRSYPTIGPSGDLGMDVNGVAASIELYLGEDVLLGDEKQLIPVQWTALIPPCSSIKVKFLIRIGYASVYARNWSAPGAMALPPAANSGMVSSQYSQEFSRPFTTSPRSKSATGRRSTILVNNSFERTLGSSG
jgi:hypothetical protein